MKGIILSLGLLISLPVPSGTGTTLENEIISNEPVQDTIVKKKVHLSSFYGDRHHGRTMANGKVFDKNKMTCASTAKYKLGTKLKVTNIKNGKSVIVTVTDRGDFKKYGRTLDLSEGAFKEIASLKKGVIKVEINRL